MMTDPTLEMFRMLAEAMSDAPRNWQWIGQHESQRMFGISQTRAEDLARRFGGDARRMS